MIEISMDPFLLTVGSLNIAWHGLMTGVAVLVGLIIVTRLARSTDIAIESVYSAALWAIVGGIIGARVVHVADHWGSIYGDDPWQMLYFWEGGLSLYGAIYGGFLFGAVYCLLRKLPMGRLADLAVPGVIVAQAIGRIGCLINGDAYGTLTSLPWGVFYTHPNAASSTVLLEARHPVPAYEIIYDLLIFALLLRLRKRLKRDWMLFLVYASAYATGRFFLSFIRGDEVAVLGSLHEAHVISLIVIAVTVPLLIWLARRPAPESVEARAVEEERLVTETASGGDQAAGDSSG